MKHCGLIVTMLLFIPSLVLYPVIAWSCEPIVPLAMLYSGTATWGLVATTSLWGLLIAIAVKSLVFLWKSDFKSYKAILFMLLANIYSTLPGILLTIAFSVPTLVFFTFFIYLIPAKNMVNYKPFNRIGIILTALILSALTFATLVIFRLAWGLQDISLTWYWVVKIVYSTVAIGISFLITIVCEETVISYLYEKHKRQRRSFFEPVVWANVVVFIIVVGTAAFMALPKRLASPNFLIHLFKPLNLT